MDEKRFRFDLFIAGIALVISTFAAAASAYQAYVINQQFSATVWPYLSFASTRDSAHALFQIDVRNSGLGPAIVRSTVVTVEGVPMSPKGPTGNAIDSAIAPDLTSAESEERSKHVTGVIHTTSSSLERGDVIPAGSSVTLLRVAGPLIWTRVSKTESRIDVAVCYCSLLGRCWMTRRSDPSNEPHDVRSCPTPT
jgi:hypothetical protein